MPFPAQEPRLFTRESIMVLNPGQIGCYGLYVAGQHWVYVGRGDIRARLLDHLNGDNPCITRNRPTHFVTAVTRDAEAEEKRLIIELSPGCNQKVG